MIQNQKILNILFVITTLISICVILYLYDCNGTCSAVQVDSFKLYDLFKRSKNHVTRNYENYKNIFTRKYTKLVNANLLWLDHSEGINFNNYGDKTCGDNPDRKILRIIFQKWIELSRLANISYFISTGTLLGSWRNGDIIPYDTDLDVMIDSRDNTKLDRLKNIRNFHESDNKFHLILQEDWELEYKKRRRFKCNGKKSRKILRPLFFSRTTRSID